MFLGRVTKRKLRFATRVGNGEITPGDDVHPYQNICTGKLAHRHLNIREPNIVGKYNVYLIRWNILLTVYATNFDKSSLGKTASLYDGLRDNRTCGAGVPKRLKFMKGGLWEASLRIPGSRYRTCAYKFASKIVGGYGETVYHGVYHGVHHGLFRQGNVTREGTSRENEMYENMRSHLPIPAEAKTFLARESSASW